MTGQTFKKRQKEAARKEKRQKKEARRLERKQENKTPETGAGTANPEIAEIASTHGPTIL
jgi:hypothetical protein